MLKVFQQITKTGILPAGSSLHVTTQWTGYNGYAFDVWSVNPTMSGIAQRIRNQICQERHDRLYLRIRNRKLTSRPSTQQKDGLRKPVSGLSNSGSKRNQLPQSNRDAQMHVRFLLRKRRN